MLNIVLIFEVALFSIAGIAVLPHLFKYWRSLDRNEKVLTYAWSAMIFGQNQIFAHADIVQGVSSIDAGAIYQLTWMLVAGLISLPIFLSARIPSSVWRLPVVALTVYVFCALGSAGLSIAPAFTIYRASQVAIDLALLLVAYSTLKKSGKPDHLIIVSVFWLVILLLSVLLGALIVPDEAFFTNEGALGESLRGVVPNIHPNELGLMAAIGIVVGIVRGLGGAARGWRRVFWFSVALISGTILFLAQARTSLGSSLIALFAVGFMVRRLRWLAYVMVGVGIFVGAYYMFNGGKLGVEDEIVTYARRGSSDKNLETLSGRTVLWQIGWEMFKDSPVLGHGFETGVRNEGVKYGLALGTNMHSAYLQVLVDTGALGSIAWLIYVFGMSAITYKYYRYVKKSDEPTHMFAVEILLVVFVILFRSFLGHVLVSHQMNLTIFLSIYLYTVLQLEGASHRQRFSVPNSETESKDTVLRYRKVPSVRSRSAGLKG